MTHSKRKGDNYERKLRHLFQDWSDVPLRRSPLSGGWTRDNPKTSADLIPEDPDQPFVLHVEAKNQEGWSLDQLFTETGPVWSKWWKQATDECAPNRLPVLVFSKAHKPDYILFRRADVPHDPVDIYIRIYDCAIMLLNVFLENTGYAELVAVVNGNYVQGSALRQRVSDATSPVLPRESGPDVVGTDHQSGM